MSKLLGALAIIIFCLFVGAFAFFAFSPVDIEQNTIVIDVAPQNAS